MRAYYFSSIDKKLKYGDNRQIRKGRTHKVKGEIRLCKNGLHASVKALDALKHAPDCYLWVVELGGMIVEGDDKCAARERTYIRGFNAEKLLRKFAREQALISIGKIKPHCDLKAVEAARSAEATAEAVAWSAAWSTAWSAESPVSAVWPAAWSAAASARSATRAAANEMLEEMIAVGLREKDDENNNNKQHTSDGRTATQCACRD